MPTFAATLCLVALTNPFTQASSQPMPPIESVLKQVIAKAENEQDNDRQFRKRYAYTRTKVTEYLDAKGQLKRRQEKTGRNVPRQFRPAVPSDNSSATNRNSPPLTRPDKDRNIERREFEKSDFALDGDLLNRFQFTLVGREFLYGRSALVIDFHPAKKDLPVHSFQDRFLNKAAGRVWVDEIESVVVKADLYLTDKVNVAGGLVGAVGKFTYQFDRERTSDGLWFTRQVKWHLEGRQIFVHKVIDHFEEKKDVKPMTATPSGESPQPPRPMRPPAIPGPSELDSACRSGNQSSADFQLCRVVNFQIRRLSELHRPADLEVGDTAGLERGFDRCAVGPLANL